MTELLLDAEHIGAAVKQVHRQRAPEQMRQECEKALV